VGENCMEGGELIYRTGEAGSWAVGPGLGLERRSFSISRIFSLFFFFINGLFFLIWSLGFRS
jgi:hypothetical protein